MTIDISTGPRRAARRLAAATGAVALAATAALGVGAPAVGAADDPDPILFVHGFRGDGSRWATMIDRFEADG